MLRTFLVSLVLAVPAASPASAPVQPFTSAERANLALEIENSLQHGLLEAWYPRCVDGEKGGFLCDFDYRWRPAGPHDKNVVYQARQTWVASRAMLRYPDDPRYEAAARHGFKWLKEGQWDRERGGWYWWLDREGRIKPDQGDLKHGYGISFGIYACAAYYAATGDQAGLDLAKEAFAWLEKHAHDGKNGGYFEFYTREGTPILSPEANPLGGATDSIGTRIGYKSMNTHIHLMESLTELYGVWKNPLVEERLEELFKIVRDRITVAPGAMHLYFHPDWTPIPDHDSYGHDVETGFLLLEAAEALGTGSDSRTRAVARSLVDHAMEFGWDEKNGGFWYGGPTFGGEPFHADKAWWVQAEGLNALLLMAREFPEDRARYETRFRALWEYVKREMIDARHGGWHPSALDTGKGKKQSKASPWKAAYHDSRALMHCADMLRLPAPISR